MTPRTLHTVLQTLADHGPPVSDADLLRRFLANDEAAFAELVQRHGRLVWTVCRNLTRSDADADDAFQATFLVLVKSARKVRDAGRLSSWLHGVAAKVCANARRAAKRRALRERATCVPEGTGTAVPESAWDRALAAVHEEAAWLPGRLRVPFVLCCLEGLGAAEAAAQLGWKPGTLASRLSRAKDTVLARLGARGVACGAIAAVGLAVPPPAVAKAVAQARAGSAVPCSVLQLTQGVIGMRVTSVKLLVVVLLLGLGLGSGWALAVGLVAGSAPPQATAPEGLEPTLFVAPPLPVPPAPSAELDDPLPDGATLRFGSPRYRHPIAIKGLDVSADGKIALASGSAGGLPLDGPIGGPVRVYDLATGRVRSALDTRREPPAAIALAPDGKTIADIRDTSVYLHDAGTGEGIGRVGCPRSRPQFGVSLGFAPDGKRLLVTEGNSVHLIDVEKREIGRTLAHGDVVFAAAFAPDGKHLAAGGAESDNGDHFARLWDTATGKELRRVPFGNGAIRCVTFAADGTTVAVSGDAGKKLLVKLFDPVTGKERLAIPFPDADSVRSVAFSPDGKTLAASGGSTTRLFDTGTGKELVKIDRKAIGLRFLPGGDTLVGATANTIYRWDTKTGKSLIPEGADGPVVQIAVSPDGKRLITRVPIGETYLWDAQTGTGLRPLNVRGWGGFALSPDGRLLVLSDYDGVSNDPDRPNLPRTNRRLRAFDLADGKVIERFGAFEGDASDPSFTANGKALTAIDYRTGNVRFWDVAKGTVERSLRVPTSRLTALRRALLSPDGKVLAAAYQGEARGLPGLALKLLDTTTGQELPGRPEQFTSAEPLAYTPDGKYLVTRGAAPGDRSRGSGRVDHVFVWEIATGKKAAQFPNGATTVAFSPDGKTLAIAEPSGVIALCDTATWAVTGTFRAPRARVLALTIGPDGRVYSGYADATVLAWDPKSAKPPTDKK